MKNNIKKILIISIVFVVLIGAIVFGAYNIFKDNNSLTISEKTWINNNKNSVFTINVPNDVNVFGKNGSGVFFDFISGLGESIELNLNSNVYSVSTSNDSLGFNVSTSYDKRDLLFFTDYYVLVNAEGGTISSLNNIKNSTIGILSTDVSFISSYYDLTGTIKTFDSKEELFNSLSNSSANYIIVPRIECLDTIIERGYNISYFFDDAKLYYYLHLAGDETLNSIMKKYYNNWMTEKFATVYNNNNYKMFVDSLKITDVEVDSLTDKTYLFEYLPTQPYQLLSKGEFSGIVSEYLKSFSEFSSIDFNYKGTNAYKNFKYDIEKKKADLFFTSYNYIGDYKKININLPIDYYLIGKRDLNITIHSLKSLNEEVYVLEDSNLYSFLSRFGNITTKTYKNISELKRLIKKGNIVLVDKLYYDNYLVDNIDNLSIYLSDTVTGDSYGLYYKNDGDTFYRLFRSYVNSLNPKEMTNSGLVQYFKTYRAGSRTLVLAKYIILLIIVLVLGGLIIIRNKKKIVLNTKVKNNEKIRYVDMLTSLKNRNYLNDRIEIWNQNTVYPQAVIVLDINNVKYLNDTFGHEEGDKQIKALANALFKTQLENTELIRTDGNEFMVYMVGYSEKQVVNYIKKLIKEFKKLPYEYGVAVGFSMINDDLKLIEDAFNEATIQMRENKHTFGENDEK